MTAINLLPVCVLCDGPRDCQHGWSCFARYMSPPEIRTVGNRLRGLAATGLWLLAVTTGGRL